jgi:hypothetical protein
MKEKILSRLVGKRQFFVALFLLIISMLSIHVLDVPWSLVRLDRIAGGIGILDMQFHYSGKDAYNLLNALGSQGREFYIFKMLCFADIFLPLIMAFFLFIAINLSLRKSVGERTADILTMLPLGAMLFDYVENALIAVLLLTFPEKHILLASISGYVTTIKFILYWAGASASIVGGLFRLYVYSKNRYYGENV